MGRLRPGLYNDGWTRVGLRERAPRLQGAGKKAKVREDLRLHDLPHLRDAPADPGTAGKVVQATLGHSQISLTSTPTRTSASNFKRRRLMLWTRSSSRRNGGQRGGQPTCPTRSRTQNRKVSLRIVVSPLGVEPRTYRLRERRGASARGRPRLPPGKQAVFSSVAVQPVRPFPLASGRRVSGGCRLRVRAAPMPGCP